MPSLSFKKRFREPILNGSKTQTIRRLRKYPVKPGDILYLFIALRTIHVEKLLEVQCKSVSYIKIYINSGLIDVITYGTFATTRKTYTGTKQLNAFAKSDGFTDWEDMKAFWIAENGVKEHGAKRGAKKKLLLPFEGQLIKW